MGEGVGLGRREAGWVEVGPVDVGSIDAADWAALPPDVRFELRSLANLKVPLLGHSSSSTTHITAR